MTAQIGKRSLYLLLAAAFLLLSACTSSAAAQIDETRRDELSQEFADALVGTILPNRDAKSVLREAGVYVSDEEYVAEFGTVEEFVNRAQAGVDCVLTVAFYNKSSYIVTRFVFSEGAGYYFRYEYDSRNPEQIALDFRAVQDVQYEVDEELQKLKLTVNFTAKDVAVFTFRREGGLLLPGLVVE